jgi:F420-dependent oxidoreductase-like protein
VRVGLQVKSFNMPQGAQQIGPQLAEIARAAEEAGFYSLWVMDHFFQLDPMIGSFDDPMMESYTTLGYLAGVTSRIKLGALVTGVVYRQPAVLVKAATSLDVVSGGRSYFGIGAAWYQREADSLGLFFPSQAERFERLEEVLQIVKQAWSGKREPFEGKYYRLHLPVISPQPVSRQHPPILIGGSGENKTLRMVAQYADASNFIFRSLEEQGVGQKLEVLKQHCRDLGRDYDEIEKTVLTALDVGPNGTSRSDIIKHCEMLARLGVQHVIFNFSAYDRLEPIEMFAKHIIPKVSQME